MAQPRYEYEYLYESAYEYENQPCRGVRFAVVGVVVVYVAVEAVMVSSSSSSSEAAPASGQILLMGGVCGRGGPR